MNTLEQVLKILHRRGFEEAKAESSFVDLDMDSLDKAEIALDCDTEIDVAIPDEDLENIHSVAELVKFIDDQRAEKA